MSYEYEHINKLPCLDQIFLYKQIFYIQTPFAGFLDCTALILKMRYLENSWGSWSMATPLGK